MIDGIERERRYTQRRAYAIAWRMVSENELIDPVYLLAWCAVFFAIWLVSGIGIFVAPDRGILSTISLIGFIFATVSVWLTCRLGEEVIYGNLTHIRRYFGE